MQSVSRINSAAPAQRNALQRPRLADEKGETPMASIQKFTHSEAFNQFRHVLRQLSQYGNPDVKPEKIGEDYYISPPREKDGYSLYKTILDKSYIYGKRDLKTLAGIIVTLPQDVPADGQEERNFFKVSYAFLNERYCGEEHCCTAVVHHDESGQPHLHYLFVPVVKLDNPKHDKEWKVCASDVLSRDSYYTLHNDMQAYLDSHLDFRATVANGVTRAQGGNKTVRELKSETPRKREERERKIIAAQKSDRWHHHDIKDTRDRGRW